MLKPIKMLKKVFHKVECGKQYQRNMRMEKPPSDLAGNNLLMALTRPIL